MKNVIVIEKNYLKNYEDENICICDKKVIFKKSGDYTLEYIDSNDICLEIVLLDDVIVKLFICSKDLDIESYHHYQLGKNSNLMLFQFYCNKSVKEKKIVDLDGENSHFYQGFSSISTEKEEYHIIVNHNHKNVYSNISNKCIGFDGASMEFVIDSVLMKGNTDCVMDQNTRILTMGDVNAKIVPNMFIDEDSVEARHGSVIGGFHKEDIFYLMSRGISYDEAVMLLIKGFIFSNLIVDMGMKAMILNCIQDLRR